MLHGPDGIQHGFQHDRFHGQVHFAGLELGYVQNVIYKREQIARRAVGFLNPVLHLFLLLLLLHLVDIEHHHMVQSDQAVEWGSYLMAHIG